MMKLRWLLLILALFWMGCEDDKDDTACTGGYEVCCISEIGTMTAAAEAMETAEGLDEILAGLESFCESMDDVIQCAGDAGTAADELAEMQESYDELCGE